MTLNHRKIAIVGAESTGKSTLAAALGESLPAVVVPESLRRFVDEHGRVPTRTEQADVMAAQAAQEVAAIRLSTEDQASGTRGAPDWVVSDGGTLMTAVYSVAYYDDPSLLPTALAHLADYALTVWCDTDIPWVPEPGQRDGAAYRDRVHMLLQGVFGALPSSTDIEWVRVRGTVAQRVEMVRSTLASQHS